MTCNSRNPSKSLEARTEGVSLDGATISVRKDFRTLDLPSGSPCKISSHSPMQVGTDRDVPHPTKPLAVDCDHVIFQVNVLLCQPQRLSLQCSRTVQKQQKSSQSSGFDLARVPTLTEPR
jgi:hypothetical protein